MELYRLLNGVVLTEACRRDARHSGMMFVRFLVDCNVLKIAVDVRRVRVLDEENMLLEKSQGKEGLSGE